MGVKEFLFVVLEGFEAPISASIFYDAKSLKVVSKLRVRRIAFNSKVFYRMINQL